MTGKLPAIRQALLRYLPPILSGLLAVVISFRRLIFEPGFVIYRDLYPGQLYYPTLWSSSGSFLAIENYKFITFTGLFLPLQVFGADIFEKAVYLGAAIIAYASFYLTAYTLLAYVKKWDAISGKRHLISGLGALTFLLNPAATNIFFDFSLFVGYAFSPLIVLLLIQILDGRTRFSLKILLVAVLWWMSAIKAHFIVFGGLLLIPPFMVWAIVFGAARRERLARNAFAIAAIVGLYLLLSSYWLLPYLQASEERFVGSYAPMTYESLAYLSYSPWYDALRLLGSFKAWPYVRYGPPQGWLMPLWVLASWVIPALVVYGAVRHRRHWITWVLILFSLGGFVLACGTAPPFSDFYQWLVFGPFTPGLFRWLFRVASKWNVFLSLGASGLLTLALAELMDRSARKIDQTRSSPKLANVIPLTYLSAFLLFAWPSFTGDFNGALDPQPFPAAFKRANEWLEQQGGDFKVNWMPVTNGRELSWNRRPSGDLFTAMSSQPSIATNWNRHPVLYYSYIYDSAAEDRIANLGEMLSILNTRYVAYHDDVVTTHIHEDVEPVSVLIESGEEALIDKIQHQVDLRIAWEEGEISIYEAEHFTPALFVPHGRYLVLDDLSMLASISALDDLSLDENGLYFDSSRDQSILNGEWNGLIMGLDAADSLLMSRLPLESMLSPAQFTHHGIVTQDWSRFDVYQFNWQSVLRERNIYNWGFDYGKLMAAHTDNSSGTEEPKRLSIPFSVPATGDYHLWARTLHHPQAGNFTVRVDDRPLREINGDDPVSGFRWDELIQVHLTAGDHEIELGNRNGFIALNTLAVIESAKLEDLRTEATQLYNETPGLYFLEIENDFAPGQASPARQTAALSGGRGVELDRRTAITTTLSIVAGGDYELAVRASLPTSSAPLTVTLGTEVVSLQSVSEAEELAWLRAGPLQLPAGNLPLTIQAAGPTVLDAMAISQEALSESPGAFFAGETAPAVLEYEQIDATRYQIFVRAERPFTLALAETYDPLWLASGPGFQVSSVPLYGVINGFEIPRTGSYQILVEYQAQQQARLGALLSGVVFISLWPSIWFLQRRMSRRKPIEIAP